MHELWRLFACHCVVERAQYQNVSWLRQLRIPSIEFIMSLKFYNRSKALLLQQFRNSVCVEKIDLLLMVVIENNRGIQQQPTHSVTNAVVSLRQPKFGQSVKWKSNFRQKQQARMPIKI